MLEGISEVGCSGHYLNMTTTNKKIVICLTGLTACGKSTAARRLARKYGLKYISGGTALKELALKMGYKANSKGWWETQEGMHFLERRLHDPKFDKQIDAELLEWAKGGNVVLDSWTMPWLARKGFKIWLEVSPQERAKRLAQRDGINVEKAARLIMEKDGKTKQIYRSLYGFKLGEDFQPFDLVIDGETLTSDEVFDILSLIIDRLVLNRSR